MESMISMIPIPRIVKNELRIIMTNIILILLMIQTLSKRHLSVAPQTCPAATPTTTAVTSQLDIT